MHYGLFGKFDRAEKILHSKAISAKLLVMELSGADRKSLRLVGRFYELRGKLVGTCRRLFCISS